MKWITGLLLALMALGVQAQDSNPSAPQAPAVQILVPLIISERSHDPDAFTQGLLIHNGLFYESTGLYGESDLREVNPETGEVLREFALPDDLFAEGLALVGDDRLIQITWREGVAIEYSLETFAPVTTYNYSNEGWGLCYDGETLYMTDGSARLYKRDAETFALIDVLEVTLNGEPVYQLNELECVGDDVYANVWYADHIVVIDKASGQVHTLIDAAGLITPEEVNFDSGAVLNGIAYDAAADVFYITGKRWPKLFEVRFVPIPITAQFVWYP